jgi:phospholipase/carboxylesterase
MLVAIVPEHTSTCTLALRAVGPPPSKARLTVVMMHGFGAPGDDLVDLARSVETPDGTRFVFPEGPLELPGLYGDARAWWMLDLARIERALAGIVEDRSEEIPEGLAEARDQIDALLGELVAGGARRIVIGGFSQGAMLALDVALHTAHPIAGVAFLSGTRINGTAWAERLARVRGLPVAMTHGRRDALLPFAVAESLRDQLRAAGADVDWVEFAGGHEIPPPALAALGRLIGRLAAG